MRLEREIKTIDAKIARREETLKRREEKQAVPELAQITDAFVRALREMWMSEKQISTVVKARTRRKPSTHTHKQCLECWQKYMPKWNSQKFCSVKCRDEYNAKQIEFAKEEYEKFERRMY